MNQAAAPDAVYVPERGDPVFDRETVLALWAANLRPDPARAGNYAWFYQDGPWGPAVFHLLRHVPSGTWVGVAAAGPRAMQYRGQTLRAGILADMAVAARHRSLGPALRLQTALIETAAQEFDLLYGFPNRAATAVMRRLGYPVLAPIPRFSRVLRHSVYLARRMPGVLAKPFGLLLDALYALRDRPWRLAGPAPHALWSTRVDPRMDALWARSAPRDTWMTPRDTTFLGWRFDRFPACATRYLLLVDRTDERLLAWFACQPDGPVLHVRDFWSEDAADGVGRAWIAALVRAARDAGHAAIDFEYASPPRRLANWLALGFVAREQRTVVARWTGCHVGRPPPEDFHLTAADEDV